MDFKTLKTIADIADVGNGREAIFATCLPEEPGSLKRFSEVVGQVIISEFRYRYDPSRKEALVLYSVSFDAVSELSALIDRLEASNLVTINLTGADLVKEHLRHMSLALSSSHVHLQRRHFPARAAQTHHLFPAIIRSPNKLNKKNSISAAAGFRAKASQNAGAVAPSPSKRSGGSTEELKIVKWESLQYESGFLGVPGDGGGGVSLDTDGGMTRKEYLLEILSSKVYDVAFESPLLLAERLSESTGVQFWIKREDTQSVFSFKLRGAYNMMAKLPKEQLERGVICASAGNHAQGVALAAGELGCKAIIVMPVTTPEIKWKAVERLGGEVRREGETFDDSQAIAAELAEKDGLTIIPPFDNTEIIAGQGTVGMEIMRQMNGPLPFHAIFVPIGGGGLVSGVAAYVKQVFPQVKVIGVEPNDANSMALALHLGERVQLETVGNFADALAVKAVGQETFRVCKGLLDGIVLVHQDAIAASIKDMFEETRSILEPAGAVSLAGAKAYCKYYGIKDVNVVAIASGANMDFKTLKAIADIADVGRGREAIFATCLPEEPGSLKRFSEVVGQVNISEFRYRYDPSRKEALVLYSVSFDAVSELSALIDRLEASNLVTINLTGADLVKEHLRHMIGGRSDVKDELLYEFVFPERPGALVKFLDAFSPRWNISLFHYRAQGDLYANVLVGIQVPCADIADFHARAEALGYDYNNESENDAFKYLMQ
ncbi:hypothetical protein Sjap_001306 [Stephania japonica]|uniref:Threonine dehydratase n=1 Tax=Stephania japonica TaxID=461633 RepID=A0AAP0KJS2_9MAGN